MEDARDCMEFDQDEYAVPFDEVSAPLCVWMNEWILRGRLS